jgi:hypothetical protein
MSMPKRQRTDGVQKGQQLHAEGGHGEKTRKAIMRQLHAAPREEPAEAIQAEKREAAARSGKRRLVEGRAQHDIADKVSERNRLHREVERGRASE